MSKPTVELTEAEWSIIKAVWENEPCTAPAIQEKLLQPTGWTYSTVRTLMDRMVAKGVLRAKKEGKLTIYHSASPARRRSAANCFTPSNTPSTARSPRWCNAFWKATDWSAEELKELESLIKAKKKSAKKITDTPGGAHEFLHRKL